MVDSPRFKYLPPEERQAAEEFGQENPYTKSYYETAKEQGAKFVDSLTRIGLTPEQQAQVLRVMPVDIGLKGAILVDSALNTSWFENREAHEIARDWVLETVAGAQDTLAQRMGIQKVNGSITDSSQTPRKKYRSPKK